MTVKRRIDRNAPQGRGSEARFGGAIRGRGPGGRRSAFAGEGPRFRSACSIYLSLSGQGRVLAFPAAASSHCITAGL